MNEIQTKLLQLEERRNDIEKVQKNLRESMVITDEEEYAKKRIIYYKNKDELKDIINKINILNNAIDILEGIGVEL